MAGGTRTCLFARFFCVFQFGPICLFVTFFFPRVALTPAPSQTGRGTSSPSGGRSSGGPSPCAASGASSSQVRPLCPAPRHRSPWMPRMPCQLRGPHRHLRETWRVFEVSGANGTYLWAGVARAHSPTHALKRLFRI